MPIPPLSVTPSLRLALLLAFTLSFAQASRANTATSTDYIGARACAGCHQQQFDDWQGSHHDQAMMHANIDSVLGDFDRAHFSYNGISSTFFKRGDEFWVNTDGADGKLQDFKIAYTFGVEPLQQYLIGFEDGRFQALSIAWDSRPKQAGGQRWFHLYPDEQVDANDVLHWSRQSQNWNSRCAECHSTNLQKHYDSAANRYATTWSEINVSCESCHGPGAAHLDWAAKQQPDRSSTALSATDKGLLRDIAAINHWQRAPSDATAHSTVQNSTAARDASDAQINRCAQCHSRRAPIHRNHPIEALSDETLDSHILSLIEEPLYFSDGQIRDEVYVYGSFLQSKMHQRGVVCSNCHEPHSLQLKAPGNALCAQCHNPAVFDQSRHHRHQQDSDGAQCVNCHMPTTTYMVVDPRRDHSLRIPRPDLSQTLGVPNACNQCHDDKTTAWSAQHFQQWYPGRSAQPHYGQLFALAQQGGTQALPQLAAMAHDLQYPAIVRASALQLLRNYSNQYAINTAQTLLESGDPLIRLAALRVLEMMDLQQRMTYLWPLLDDEVKAVRLEAARLLAGVGLQGPMRAALSADREAQLKKGVDEYIAAAQGNADSPAGQLQLGVMYQALRHPEKARQAYQQALLLEPSFIPALINMADLYRAQGQDPLALPLMQKALAIVPDDATVNYSLGLLYIRLQQLPTALPYLAKAAKAAPEVGHYSYVYGVALFENGQQLQAIKSLQQSLQRHPGNRNILAALGSYLNALGRPQEAQQYMQQLQ